MGAYNPHVVTRLISEALERQGYGSLTALAKACGVQVQTVSKWRDGEVVPRPERWPTIEDALELTRGQIAKESGYTGPTLDDLPIRVARLEGQIAEILQRLRPDTTGDGS